MDQRVGLITLGVGDPGGHPWEVAHNLHWTLRDDGSVALAP